MSKSDDSRARYYAKYIDNLLPSSAYDFDRKPACVSTHIAYMLNRTQSMFRWDGLPDTIPARMVELYLQTAGYTCFYEHEGNLYVFVGGLGGEYDEYYRPTICTISNPALKLSVSARINHDCVVMPNDSMYYGLLPLFNRYAAMLVENELSLKLALINSRIIDLISAPDDRTKVSAEKFLADIAEGRMGVIADNAFLEGIKAQPYGTTANSNLLTNLLEVEQYLKGSWYHEIGLNANYNMKRESLNSAESGLNSAALLPLVDDMLKCRQDYAARVNDMFGTTMTVDLASSWHEESEELSMRMENEDEAENDREEIK